MGPMDWMLRAKDQFGRVTTKVFESESEFLQALDLWTKNGYEVEAWVRKHTWELYKED